MKRKTSYLLYNIIGVLFVFFCYAEYVLAKDGNILWNMSWIVKLILVSLIGGVVLGSSVCFLLYKIEEKWASPEKKCKVILPEPKKLFGISWGCTMLCWMPGFLAYYPGINAYDFGIQLEQITLDRYNAHHPLAHTLLMEGFIRLGNRLGSGSFGLAVYTLLQMCILAVALAVGISFLRRHRVKSIWLIGLQCLACFMPSNIYLSISATKDILFTAFTLLFAIVLCSLMEERGEKLQFSLLDVGHMVFGVLVVLFRNNGIYALMAMSAGILLAVIFGKKARLFWLKILSETVVILVIGSLFLSALFRWTDAVQGDKREMLSVPIQQLARTMVYHGGIGVIEEDDNSMDEVDKALINDFILYESYRDYDPAISDPVKGKTNTYVFVYRMKEFLQTYLKLLKQYPGDYINAFLGLTAGYWSPFDVSHGSIYEYPGVSGLGYIQTARVKEEGWGIFIEPKLPGLLEKMELFADENLYLKIPVINVLMVPGTWFWALLVAALWLLTHKKYELLIPFILVLGYFATLFLGPTVQLRYIYPVMTLLPYLCVWAVNKMYKEKESV